MQIRKILAEFVGTMFLLACIVGSGHMAQQITLDTGIQLLINALSTSLGLVVLITLFAKISGANFNPIVTLVSLANKNLGKSLAIAYILAQISGAILGVILANLMFNHPAIYLSQNEKSGVGLILGEVLATAGLIFIIFGSIKSDATSKIPFLVGAWIGSAYFFTSSTSFANPAVTFARSLTDSFSGISIDSVMVFSLAQCLGALIGFISVNFFFKEVKKEI